MDRRNAYPLGLRYRIETAKSYFLQLQLLPLDSSLQFPTIDAKYLEVYTFKDERDCNR
jgi:hypothetical protein